MCIRDSLNIAACFSVIALHCNQMVHTWQPGKNWLLALLIEVLFYWAVPVFLMLTGATLMRYRDRYDTKTFLSCLLYTSGTYDCTGSGAVKSWAEIAHAVFDAANGNGDKVVPVSTADYYASAEGPIAPRPVHSALDLSKLEAAGFHMLDWERGLSNYLQIL